ncbi:MAG: methyltransferase domain-containing protein, partial [Bdellovibrionales bacterium]|nr:methyltransferase domain-containing protein [Bdellovibrionales bacterium]
MDKFIQLDEEGYFHFEGRRINDNEFGKALLHNLTAQPLSAYYSLYQDEKIIVEAFDAPLVVIQVEPIKADTWRAYCPYDYQFEFSLHNLMVDEWDRFLGYDDKNRPFVFSRTAQATFFNSVDSFDDDSVTFAQQKYPILAWLKSSVDTKAPKFWEEKYQQHEKPGWELNKPSPPLVSALPQLKINKCRILVPGCGTGNDAAFLAQQGHIVTAIDFSQEALRQAEEKYGHIKNLKFVNADIFQLPESSTQAFDLIFEHTLFCAVPFEKRQNLIKVYKRCLVDKGYLLGVFFVMEQKAHPPYGGSEWE